MRRKLTPSSELLKQLKRSPLLDHERRKELRASISAARKRGAIDREAEAQVATVTDIVQQLGERRYLPAAPTLAALWPATGLSRLERAVGGALFAMGDGPAWDALVETGLARRATLPIALRVVFARADPDPVDVLAPILSRPDLRLADDLLFHLRSQPWDEPGGAMREEWLRAHPRLLDLIVALRSHDLLGWRVRDLLRALDPALTAAALARARATETPPARTNLREARDGSLLRRYERGEHLAVWAEIRAAGPIGGAFREEVLEVAEASMRRVAANVDLIAERLEARGWRTLSGEGFRIAPSAQDAPVVAEMERLSGAPIPPTLLAFWRVVGGVDFIWDYRSAAPAPDLGTDLPMDQMDPLCVAAAHQLAYQLGEWEDQIRERKGLSAELHEPFEIELAPDIDHKMNCSGGPPYSVEVPWLGADPAFETARHHLPFLDYLRLSVRWAGFPELEAYAAGDEDVRRFVADFGADLAPF